MVVSRSTLVSVGGLGLTMYDNENTMKYPPETVTYPASLIPKEDGEGFHVRFPDLPEALAEGDDLPDALVQAANCLAKTLARRINLAAELPTPSKANPGQHLISFDIPPKLIRAMHERLRHRFVRE
jgi:predicted RNase H-like HicB family nuclease